jgi:hypothetical protein
MVSNAAEDARTSHPCESGASFLKATQGAGVAKFSRLARKISGGV